MSAGVVDGDLGGEVLGLENDGGGEVGERSVVGHAPLSLHALGALAEEGVVALAADEGKILIATGLLEDEVGEFLFRVREFPAGGDALCFEQALFDEFRPAGLDGEVGLGKGDLLLPGVAVLGDEVAGVTGEHDVVDLAFRSLGQLDQFVDVNKMIGNGVAGDFAGGFCLGNGGLVEVPPLGVAQKLLEVACQPVFHAVFSLLGVAFEGFGELLDEVGFHKLMIRKRKVLKCRVRQRVW